MVGRTAKHRRMYEHRSQFKARWLHARGAVCNPHDGGTSGESNIYRRSCTTKRRFLDLDHVTLRRSILRDATSPTTGRRSSPPRTEDQTQSCGSSAPKATTSCMRSAVKWARRSSRRPLCRVCTIFRHGSRPRTTSMSRRMGRSTRLRFDSTRRRVGGRRVGSMLARLPLNALGVWGLRRDGETHCGQRYPAAWSSNNSAYRPPRPSKA
jgi:hypothetical protein